ncbi:chorismate mutase [Desulfotomaculum arcticum]|uniref:UPF0735 ACT domain-containing protein SAMN05660649_00161 n=1 Tax=Desulfotruncus arcticus DSM 17038 TaxID=1121424 RepID=A0A1I2MVY5_9FIRM|nr:ACT domain-containing protein [Desulfotruncus arcticus]SFF95050.1 chorismate mutase [Desulfotomaculum arcticum] [Desulfotruncus arcticus DSM 17038]
MAGREPRFFLVREDVLPEAINKTVQAKELLMRGDATNVAEAVEKVCLSRSAFYKYRDKVYPFHRWQQDQTVTMELTLEHRSGVLSALLSNIAAVGGNVVTINQNLPQQGVASASITIETNNLECDVEQMLNLLRNTLGVKKARFLGS